MEEQEYITLRVWKQTHKNLRIVAAHQEEKLVETLNRLVAEELQRIESRRVNEEKAEQD